MSGLSRASSCLNEWSRNAWDRTGSDYWELVVRKDTPNACSRGSNLSRREFVKALQGGAVVLVPVQSLAGPFLSAPKKVSAQSKYKRKFFKKGEAAVIEAISSRIIPSDDSPGAREARAVDFIDHCLATLYAAQQLSYREGIRRLNRLARARYKRTFDRLSVARQDLLLSHVERGQVPGWNDAGAFFQMVRLHTIEGMFADPKYHGNASGVGWRLLGSSDQGQ